ncbi:MAG: M20/M25/M40 family metallo-hydrolase [Planctomycetes bacterium]|nr:M20/M25/M40 family metallo-hydrolase [Planctomycetota bacterium]
MEINRTRLRDTAQQLVQIPSHQEVDSISNHILHELKDTGLDSVYRDRDGNIIGTIGHGDGLLLNAHLDTVDVQGFDGDPYSGRIQDNRLIGRGASDCKAGVAAMMEIARVLSGQDLPRRLIFAFTVWEEGGAGGTNGAFGAARRADATEAIVLESTVKSPPQMNVEAGCGGILRMDISVRGKAGHSSDPDNGDNAVYRAADFITRFQKCFVSEKMPETEIQVLGKTIELQSVVSLTEIHAMQGRNIIPDRCLIGLDCRLFPGQDEKAIKDRITALAKNYEDDYVRFTTTSSIPGHFCEKTELIQNCISAAKKNGFQSTPEITMSRTDSTVFHNEAGIPAVVFGPGTSGEAHTKNESLHLPSFYSGTQACLDAVTPDTYES